MNGVGYYRLRQVDFNGAFELFPAMVFTPYRGTGNLMAWPNPFNEALNLFLSGGAGGEPALLTAVVRDIAGRVVMRQPLELLSGSTGTIKGWGQVPAGAYLIDVEGPTGASFGQVWAMHL